MSMHVLVMSCSCTNLMFLRLSDTHPVDNFDRVHCHRHVFHVTD